MNQPDSLEAFAKILFEAITSGNWTVVAAAALVLVVAVVRIYGKKLQDALPDSNPLDKGLTFLFSTTWGGWILNILTAIAGALASALLASAPITWGLVGAAIVTALSGAALWELLKDILNAFAKKQAQIAGQKAADAVKTPSDAVKAINDSTKP